MSDDMMAARAPYSEETYLLEFFNKNQIKLTNKQESELFKGLEENGPRKDLRKAYGRIRESENALRIVCRDVSVEWLLTHENATLREQGKEIMEHIIGFGQRDNCIIANCTTLNEVLANYKKYRETHQI